MRAYILTFQLLIFSILVQAQTLLTESDIINKNINTSKDIGAISGIANVSLTSAATYSIPIFIPDGVKGLQPNVSVSYSSVAGNGLAGYGWILNANSSITYDSYNMYNDAMVAPVKINAGAPFSLDGQRLIPITGNTEFRTESESFSKITTQGGIVSGCTSCPAFFKVQTKNGWVMEYGNTSTSANSRVSNLAGMPVIWLLSKVYDQYGNYMEYNYGDINGERLLLNITYTKNGSTFNLNNQIVFSYSSRSDKNTYFLEGNNVTNNADVSKNNLLTKITIISEGINVREYQFNYGNEGMYTFLNEVIVSGYNETGTTLTALNSTVFKYNTSNAAPTSQSYTYSGITGTPDIYTGDFNGDGYDDIFAAYYTTNSTGKTYNTGKVFLNTKSNNFSLAATYNLPTSETFPSSYNLYQIFSVADINGDGRDDIIVELRGAPSLTLNFKLKGFATLILNSSNNALTYQTYYLPSYQTIYTGNNFYTGDYNMDGIDDVLLLSGNDKLYLNSPYASTPISNAVWATATYSAGYPTLDDGTVIPYLLNADTVINRDFNGDGYLDFYIVNHVFNFWNTTTSGIDIAPAKTRIMSMEASCYAGATVLYLNNPNAIPNTFTGDFNGDGYTDFFGYKNNAWIISYFKGNAYLDSSFTFNEAISTTNLNNNTESIEINDYNGDGKSDILHYYSNGGVATMSIYYSYGLGGSCFKRVDITAPHSFSFKPGFAGDFNADGRTDILDTIVGNTAAFYIVQFQPKGQERLLTKVKDGFLRQTEFKYKLFSEDATFYSYTSAGSTFPLITIVPRNFGVYRIITPGGTGNISDTTYTEFSYAEAQRHAVKGFLGFKTRKSKDPMTSIITEQTNGIIDNNMTFSLFGNISTKSYYSSTPASLLSQTIIYDTIKDFTNKRYLLKVYKTIESNNINNSKIINEASIDDNGNTGYTKQSICAQSGDTVQTTTTTVGSFSSNGTWLPALPELITQTVKYKTQTPYTTQTYNSYNAQGTVASIVNFYGTTRATTTSYDYDATFGIVTKKTITPTGMTPRYTRYEYKSNNRTLDKSFMSMPGSTEQCTQWITSYDKRFNLPKGVQNGLYTNYKDSTIYDAWGRPLTSLKLPNNLTTTIAYNWSVSGKEIYSITTSPPNAPATTNYMDFFDRTIRTTSQNFMNNTITTITIYDTLGRVLQTQAPNATTGTVITNYTYGTTSDYFKLRNVNDGFKTTTYTYTYPTLGSTSTEVTTNMTVTSGIWKEQNIDAAGILTKTKDDGGYVEFTYNSMGKPTNINVAGVSDVNTMQYDAVTGWQTQLYDKNAGTKKYRYDNWGQLVYQQDNTGFEDTLTYDAIGRLIKRYRKPKGSIPDETIEYLYRTSGNGQEQLETVKLNSNIDQQYVYDTWHRPVSITQYIDGTAYTTRTAYKANNSIDTVVYPNNFALNYGYTSLGYLEKVKYGNKVLYQTTATNILNQPTAYTYGNGKSSTISYQADGTPSAFITTGIQNLAMTFDAATGNLLNRTDNTQSPAQTETFTYNTTLDRLYSITKGTVTDTITYYNNGNINKKSKVGTYNYDGTKINAVTDINYTCSNLHPKDSFLNVVKYTPFNQPDSIQQLNAIAGKYYKVGFTYGADHQRLKMVLQQDGTIKATRYYVGNYEKFTDSAGTTRHIYYINGGNGLCAIASTIGSATTLYYVYTDHLGSILKMTDSTGAVKGEQSFDAWGRERNYKDWSKDTITQPVGSPFESINSLYGYGNNAGWITRGYTGHEHLPQFDLINMNGRLYDPVVGRMLSPDNNVADASSTQAYNKYSYVNNNPLKYTDPSGWIPNGSVSGLVVLQGGSYSSPGKQSAIIEGAAPTYDWNLEQYVQNGSVTNFGNVLNYLQYNNILKVPTANQIETTFSTLYGEDFSKGLQPGSFWITWGSGGDYKAQINTKEFSYSAFGEGTLSWEAAAAGAETSTGLGLGIELGALSSPTAWFTLIASIFSGGGSERIGEDAKPITVAPPMNGNNRNNPNDHIVYRIYGYQGIIPITIKYGISDYSKYGESRPKSQLYYYSWTLASQGFTDINYEVLDKVQGRTNALALELGWVSSYYYIHNDLPLGNKRPLPIIDFFEP